MTRATGSEHPTERELATRLHREADRFFEQGGTALDLSQVTDRAHEIRRGRRMRATMLMAACVLAIAAPTALVASRGHEAPVTPAHRTKVDTSPLSLTGLRHGSLPHDGYAATGKLHLEDTAIPLGDRNGTVTAVVRTDGGIVVAVRGEDGTVTAHVVDEQGGTSGQSWPMEGDFAVSEGGNVVAFAEPDGTVLAVQDGGSRWFELGKVPQGSGFDAIAVLGENCSGRSEQASCAIYVTTHGEQPQTYLVKPHDPALAVEPSRTVDVWGDQVAGFSSVSDTGSCSEVRNGSAVLWSTCEHRLLSFSPDGGHVLASSAYADGMGDGELAILDSRAGKAVLDLRTADQAVITRMVWEDDRHVLATVFEDNEWAVVRIGLDGSRELAVPPVPDSGDLESPYVLPTR